MKIQLCAVALLLFAGCGGALRDDAERQAAETKAASLLKRYQVAQNVQRMESDGQFGSMQQLLSSGKIEGELAQAFDKSASPTPVNGYLFAEIETGADGAPLQRFARAGLCAYPESGKGKVILMLLDTSDPQEWAFYSADAEQVGGAVRRWPSAGDLQSKFTRAKQYTPQDALKEAEKKARQ
jgi:hypothetical protein